MLRYPLAALAGLLTLAVLPGPVGAQSLADAFQSDQPITLDADECVLQQDKRLSVCTGNVEMHQGSAVLKTRLLRIFFDEPTESPKPPAEPTGSGAADPGQTSAASASAGGSDSAVAPEQPQSRIRRLEAEGKVYINSRDQTATGDRAVYDVANRLITLSGHVVLSQGNNVVRGDTLTVDLTTKEARVQSSRRVQGLFYPSAAGQ